MSELEDQAAILRLVSIYCSAVDDGDADRMASLFTPDGRLVVYPPGASPGVDEPLRRWEGAQGFRGLIAALGQSYARWIHFLGNHWVDVDGDGARGEAYLFSMGLRDGAHGQSEEVSIIRYKDAYVRTPDGWRFQERNACRQWTTMRPLSAGQHEIDAILQGRRS